jgi:prepilin-type N-terminal cleavage/methylation domain-containing protein
VINEKNKDKKRIFKNRNSGFTTVEILVVAAIVSILASVILVALNSARDRAHDGSFRSTVASTQKALIVCCSTSTALTSPVNPGQAICSSGDFYPGPGALGGITVNTSCTTMGNFSVTVIPGANNTGACTNATITGSQISYTDC